jgi:hypothetical protein
MGWKVESSHVEFLASTRVVHHTALTSARKSRTLSRSGSGEPMILPAVAASCVQEDNFLLSLTRLFIEDLALPPQRRLDVNIATNDAVVVQIVLSVFRSGASERVVQKFQDTTPYMGPARESVL